MDCFALVFEHDCECECHNVGFISSRETCFRGCVECDEETLTDADILGDPVRYVWID